MPWDRSLNSARNRAYRCRSDLSDFCWPKCDAISSRYRYQYRSVQTTDCATSKAFSGRAGYSMGNHNKNRPLFDWFLWLWLQDSFSGRDGLRAGKSKLGSRFNDRGVEHHDWLWLSANRAESARSHGDVAKQSIHAGLRKARVYWRRNLARIRILARAVSWPEAVFALEKRSCNPFIISTL